MARRGGIFCIENWSDRLSSADTVRPVLDFLEDHGAARVIHQRVATTQELGYYLSRFAELESYPVGYLAMHGSAGGVNVGAKRVKLETLTAWSRLDSAPDLDGLGRPKDWVLNLEGKVLYLGSCSTLNITSERLKRLRKATGLRMVCGYRKPVGWFESAGFDVILLSTLARALEGEDQQRHLRQAMRRLHRDTGGLMNTLGFTSDPVWVA